MTDLAVVLSDLTAECHELDALVAALDDDRWGTPTPAQGWTVAHQIAHLAWTDRVARLSATDPDAFAEVVEQARQNPVGFVDEAAQAGGRTDPLGLLKQWRSERTTLIEALRAYPAGQKLGWFGPPMGATSMATARVMETWAHGQDVADALRVTREPTRRLRHVAHIGVRTRNFAYSVQERTPPEEEFRVELAAPDGGTWAWGREDAPQRVSGPALDFCLLVTQRRHRDDLALEATGPDARQWLSIAQAFAGAPGNGRTAGQFS